MAKPTGPYLPPRRGKLRALSNPLVLWVVLIVTFLAIWRFLNDGGDSAGACAARHHASSGTNHAILTLVMPGAFFVIFLGYFLFMRRRATRFNTENLEALKLFAAADYAGAAARFADLTRRYRSPANLPAVAEYNEALAITRGGALDEALARLTALDRRITRTRAGAAPADRAPR